MLNDTNTNYLPAAVNEYFRRSGFRSRLRVCIFAPYLDDCVLWMNERGFPRNSIYETLRNVLRLAEFAEGAGIRDPALLTDELIARILETVKEQPRLHKEIRLNFRRIMEFLREHEIVPSRAFPTERVPLLIARYLRYLVDHRGISDGQVRLHHGHVRTFVEDVGTADEAEPLSQLDAAAVFRFVTTRSSELSRGGRKSMCAALRSFLRFGYVDGHLQQDLSSAVPVIPSFKLDRLPPVIEEAHIRAILGAINRSTRVGRRDYAMLLLLATYGIRAGQICALRLDDIDWRNETIRVRGVKGGGDTMLPLRPVVGDAIIEYLRDGRPSVGSWREVFLRVRAPIGPLRSGLTNIIKPYARKTGLKDVPLGSHAWRHAVASRMLANGQTLKTIRDTLGHSSIETTFIYTKVDIEKLREAALEWPEVTP